MASSPGEVLIADADASIRGLLVAIVRRMSREAVLAGDGRSALELLQHRHFDAVILDLCLPEISGRDVLAELARADLAMVRRVVVLTSAMKIDCPHSDLVAAVLRKPFALPDLRAALERCYGSQDAPPIVQEG